mmetsp:Transcript_28719/g.42648  ORF Transcript_28719/g.42648 Transcript_28719/m.42648 type:complete len:204 (+) Transcript_28719:1268-1879(+)
MISGPDTTVIGRAGDNIFPSVRASNVFPHPGIPYSNNPRTGLIPNSRNKDGGAAKGTHMRRLTRANTSSNPPIPRFSPSNASPAPARATNSDVKADAAAIASSFSSSSIVLNSSSCLNWLALSSFCKFCLSLEKVNGSRPLSTPDIIKSGLELDEALLESADLPTRSLTLLATAGPGETFVSDLLRFSSQLVRAAANSLRTSL